MTGREFNLLDEQWIVVLKNDGTTETVSLVNAFERAGEFKRIAGELPTQDAAVLRLLLAVLHTVVSRYDEKGNEALLESPADAIRRWKKLWANKQFPMAVIRDYLAQYYDRFWLFDPDRPFYQVADIPSGTEYTAAKLNGELSESGNKVRLFPQRTGQSKTTLAYDEAARWLLYMNGFDDTSAKPVGKGLPSPGAGWMGKLGLIFADGDTLFSTLMLNLVLLKDGGNELWGEELPVWERDSVRCRERTEIAIPDNFAELYTLQSRRIELRHNKGMVTGYILLGGDFFQKDNALSEQMTVWANRVKSPNDIPLYQPKRHDPSRQLWRDFSSLISNSGGQRPGIVNWIARLKREGVLDSDIIRLKTVCAKYADKDFYISDVTSDDMMFSAKILSDKGECWVPMITNEIEVSKQMVDQLAYLAQSIAKASGDADGSHERDAARETAYFRLDMPFREWLEEINTDTDDQDEAAARWWDTAQAVVRGAGRELIAAAGPQALTGRTISENKKDKHYCAPDAYNYFLYRTSSRQALITGGKQNG